MQLLSVSLKRRPHEPELVGFLETIDENLKIHKSVSFSANYEYFSSGWIEN